MKQNVRFKTTVSHTALTAADRAIEDGIVPVYIAIPTQAGSVDRRIKELRNVGDIDVAVVVLDNDQSYPANELIGQPLTFECDAVMYNRLSDRDRTIDYRTHLDSAMVELSPSIFNYSLTCLLNDGIFDIGPFSAYVICDNCEDVHVIDEDTFGSLQIDGGSWAGPKGPFSSGRKFVSLYVPSHVYQKLCSEAKRQATVSLDTPLEFEPVRVGDVVHSVFGVGRVVDILNSYDADENGNRVSRPGGDVLVWANGSCCVGKAALVRLGLPKEFEVC